MAIIKIGRVRLVDEGAYVPEKEYEPLSVVDYDHSVYFAKKHVPNFEYPNIEDSEYWYLMAKAGKQGDQGPIGFSAYDVAVQSGYQGNVTQWLEELKGLNAYELAKSELGFDGTLEEWLDTFRGEKGFKGDKGEKGDTGKPFKLAKIFSSIQEMEESFEEYELYDIVVINTGSIEDEDTAKVFTKGEEEWEYLLDLSGATGLQGPKGDPFEREDFSDEDLLALKGDTGEQGPKGDTGSDGLTAYQVAVANGFVGNETEWLKTLKGKDAFEYSKRNAYLVSK